jgi:hypothetical protein
MPYVRTWKDCTQHDGTRHDGTQHDGTHAAFAPRLLRPIAYTVYSTPHGGQDVGGAL